MCGDGVDALYVCAKVYLTLLSIVDPNEALTCLEKTKEKVNSTYSSVLCIINFVVNTCKLSLVGQK